MFEQKEHDSNTREAQEPKQECIDPLPVVNKKITDGQRQDPGDGCQDSSLGAVTLTMGKKGIV